jgi:glyoxylase-like metal-dependent hydrolase (beta-lactamase superfamily II)/rhodanese-related sulfurtransferase
MFVRQFFVKGLAHSSYLLGGTGSCAIVDPQRDVGIYLDAAREMGMKITHILQTHLHADFISGHMDLAAMTGARIVAPAAGRCAFEHTAVSDGDVLSLDRLTLSVLDTPGHTPEHVSYVVTDTSRSPEPVVVFCGDTLFVGDVGRPDLFPGMAEELAGKLYDSLHGTLMKLPDHCEVLPAHGAGSLCGRAMGARRTSTIGYERRCNAALLIEGKAAFVDALTHNMPGAPDHFARCSAINGAGPALVGSLPAIEAMPPAKFAEAAAEPDTIVLDIRLYEAFGAMHVPGSWAIDLTGNFTTFAGWLLPPDQRILLVCETRAEAEQATLFLRRVGLDHTLGFLEGSMFAWARDGRPFETVPQLSTDGLFAWVHGDRRFQLLDVRAPGEFAAHHIEGAINLPTPDVRTRYTELDPGLPTVVVCNSGHRSTMACAILQQHGFAQVYNVAGGMMGVAAVGKAPACPMCVAPHGPTVASD